MGEIAIMKKAITKILSCFVVLVFLMSSLSVAVIASDSSNSTASNVSDLPVINDTDISTAKTVSSLGYCSYVWIEITDKYCKGYEVYVDGVYQFTEGGAGGVLDGYCSFKVTPGYHTFELTLNGKEVSKGWNCQCGTGYNWMSMNDMRPHWCEGGGGGGDCDNPPTVSFDKTKYYEGDTVHITVHNPISGQVVDYEIIDCEGNSKEFKALPYGTSSYYTLPTVSSCCYWKICFYWNEGPPPLGAGSYCSKCYSFYVCPHETPCKVWINVEDKYCKGYEVYVDGVYQFTEGESGTPDGYCKFYVTPGTHKFELRKNGCSVSKSWYCQCGTYYSWTSMNDMDPHWCECNKPTPPPVKEVKFRGTVMDIRGTTPWVQVDNVISGSEYISVGDYTDIACYTTAGETGPCGHCDIVKKGDKVEVYGKRLPIYQIPMVISICGKTSYYILTIGKPDLVVQDISWIPLNPKLGDNITFTVKIMNQGTGNAKESRLAFGVSKKDANEYCFLRSSTIPSIATGGGYDYTVDYAMTECGIYRIGATADHWVEIEESNEKNNYREDLLEIPCEIEKPDLIIQDITWEPKNPKEGDRINLYVEVKNQGLGAAGSFDVSFSFVDGSYKDCNSVSMLSAGSTSIQTFTWTANKCGYIFISAKADVNNAIPESNEENNEEERILSVSCEKPDLTISAIKWSPSNPKEGDTITFDIDITNKGLGSAGNTYVIYYIDGSTIDYDFIPPLSAGSTSTQTFTWPANKCGDIKVTAIVDRDKIVTENDETNNERTETVNIICLYLEKIWITGPTEIKAGETHQWQAYGSYSDGSQKELTNQVSWTADPSDILQNIGNGKFKGLKGGEATLKVDYEGKSASKKVTVIEKTNQPPKASFTYEKDGLTVRFTSTSDDPDGDIEIYNWFFGDGGTSNQKNPIHTYSIEGTYTVVLLVRDDKGAVDAYYEDVTIIEPKLPVVILVKNVNNQPLPKCGGEITVKAYRELGNIFDDGFGNKHVAEEREAYKGGNVLSVLTLEVPKDAKFIRVWQKPNIEDGIEEYWGSAEISPPGGVFFTRHTPWLYVIDFDLRSAYTQYITMDVNNEKHIDTIVRNPENTEKKVKVRLILDRDMKLDKDMKYDFDDIGPEDGFEVPSDETDWITFRYTPREDGIWKFRAVVRTLYDDKYWIVTDQHDWYLIVGEKQIMRARSLQYVADYYIGIMSQEGEEVFQDRMAQAWANYSKDIGEILKETARSYDPVAGGLIGVFLDGGGGNSVENGVKALLDFSQAGLDAWSERVILNKAKDCNICSELDKLKKLAIEEEDCWKSGDKDINKINHVLIEEGKQLAYVEGFIKQFGPDGEVIFPSDVIGVESKIRKEMDKINDAMEAEWDYAGQTYNDLNGLGEYAHHDLVQPENARYYDWTSGRWDAGSDCAQGI